MTATRTVDINSLGDIACHPTRDSILFQSYCARFMLCIHQIELGSGWYAYKLQQNNGCSGDNKKNTELFMTLVAFKSLLWVTILTPTRVLCFFVLSASRKMFKCFFYSGQCAQLSLALYKHLNLFFSLLRRHSAFKLEHSENIYLR